MKKALDDAMAKDEPTVIITKWPCILKKFSDEDKADFDLSPKKCEIDQDDLKASDVEHAEKIKAKSIIIKIPPKKWDSLNCIKKLLGTPALIKEVNNAPNIK